MVKQPVSVNGVVRWKDVGLADQAKSEQKERKMVVLRHEIGDVLRDVRQRQGRTLREVSHSARVSLGYLSEVERGQKEASSELLSSICSALDVPLSIMLREVSDRVAVAEGVAVPDTVPQEFAQRYGRDLDRELNSDLNEELAKGLLSGARSPRHPLFDKRPRRCAGVFCVRCLPAGDACRRPGRGNCRATAVRPGGSRHARRWR